MAAERVPNPTPLQIGECHVVNGAALHTDGYREEMLDHILGLFRFARLRIDQRKAGSEVSLLFRLGRTGASFDRARKRADRYLAISSCGASAATIFSKRGSPRSESHSGFSFSSP